MYVSVCISSHLGRHEDAHEFLTFLLDAIHTETAPLVATTCTDTCTDTHTDTHTHTDTYMDADAESSDAWMEARGKERVKPQRVVENGRWMVSGHDVM